MSHKWNPLLYEQTGRDQARPGATQQAWKGDEGGLAGGTGRTVRMLGCFSMQSVQNMDSLRTESHASRVQWYKFFYSYRSM